MPATKRDDDDLPLPPSLHDEGSLLHDEESAEQSASDDGALDLPGLPEDAAEHALDDAEARDLEVGEELDYVLPDGVLPDGVLPDGVTSEGGAPEGVVASEDGPILPAHAPPDADISDLAMDLVSDDVDPDDSTGVDGDTDHDGINHVGVDDENDDDGGAEGTSERIEDEVDPDQLPELDADDDGDVTDEELLDAFVPLASDTSLPPWSDMPWASQAGSGSRVACRSVTVLDGRVVATGDEVLLVTPEEHVARSLSVEAPGSSQAQLGRDEVVVSGEQGVVLFDPTFPRSSTEAASTTTIWGRSGRVELAFAASRLWALTEGALWQVTLPPGSPSSIRDGGVLAMAAAEGTLVLLAREPDTEALCIERLRSDDEAGNRQSLSDDALRLARMDDARIVATAGGEAIALWAGGEVALSRDGGRAFHLCSLPAASSVTFAGDDARAPLLALVDDSGEAVLVEVAVDVPTVRLAEVGRLANDDDDDIAAASMAWDDSRGLVWIACRLGLLAFGPAE